MEFAVVTPWHRQDEIEAYREAWNVPDQEPDWLILQHDADREGCAVTKNKGIERAIERGADVVVVLDGDCFPEPKDAATTLEQLAWHHTQILNEPGEVRMFEPVTEPWSRGTPYSNGSHYAPMPVAASMGFWTQIGDHCAVRQLATQSAKMTFKETAIFQRYFPLCGMNLAFRPSVWTPWWRFIDVSRFDDIWQGWLWQKEAYRRGYCFSTRGPHVKHSRLSNVWANLRDEAVHLEANETLWRKIFLAQSTDYGTLRAMLPV